jgi:hypothetical protein
VLVVFLLRLSFRQTRVKPSHIVVALVAIGALLMMTDSPFVSHVLFIFFWYWTASIVEWLTHRYLMHPNRSESSSSSFLPSVFLRLGKRHLDHHAATDYDMQLRTMKSSSSTKSLVLQKFHSLIFLWPTTMITVFLHVVVAVVLSNVLPLFTVFAFQMKISAMSTQSILIYGVGVAIYQTSMWNCIHPMIHHIHHSLKVTEGIDAIPRTWMQKTFAYQWLWQNHVLHHLVTGGNKGNFNVTLPGADWLFGTYRTAEDVPRYKLDKTKFLITKIH